MKFAKILAAVLACACVVVLAACKVESSASSYSQVTLSDSDGVKIEAQNAGSDMEATSAGAIEVDADDVIVISPDLTEGSIHLTITPTNGGAAVYDDNVSGRVMFTIAVAPGEYDVKTSGNGATGSMTVLSQDGDEIIAQNAALAESVAAAGVDAGTDASAPSAN